MLDTTLKRNILGTTKIGGSMITKQEQFSAVLKKHRRLLIKAGYKHPRLTMWIYGKRHPSLEEAKKLAMYLGMDVNDIPWAKWWINE